MSVIAKFYVNRVLSFGSKQGQLLVANTVCDNDLMQKDTENYRFNQASPSGDLAMNLNNPGLGFVQGEEMYLLFDRAKHGEQPPSFEGCCLALRMKCAGVTDFGGTSKQAELHATDQDHAGEAFAWNLLPSIEGHPDWNDKSKIRRPQNVNLKITIDNPPAAAYFAPGAYYWLRIYRTDKAMAEVLSIAHGSPSALAAEAEIDETADHEVVD